MESNFGRALTIGVEEELQLVDPETLALAPGVEKLLGPEGLKTELFSCLIETNTPVCESAAEALAELVRLRRHVREAAAREGLAVAGAGSHPFSRAEEQQIVAEPRYLKMLDELGPKLRRQLVCGLHVHVGMESFEACLRTLAAIVPWLPDVLALSLNSPYVQGVESGSLSARAARLGELPRGAQPPYFASPEDWQTYIDATGKDYTRSWWDARPHPRLGTLEVPHPRPAHGGRSFGGARRLDPGALRRRSRTGRGGTRLVSLAAGGRGSAWGGADCGAPGAGRAGSARARDLGSRRGAPPAAGGAPPARDRSPRRAGGSCGRARGADGGMTLLRSVLYPLRLVRVRLSKWSGPVVLVVLGIAAGASVVVGGRAGALVAQDRAVAQAVERIPDGARSVRAVWFGSPAKAASRSLFSTARPARRSDTWSPQTHAHSSSSARARSEARSRVSEALKGSGRRWSSARDGCLRSVGRIAARCSACVVQVDDCRSRKG